MLAYVNGEFVPETEASVSINDRGFTLGDGVFDSWRTYGGRTVPSSVALNLERLRRSINYIELPGDEIVHTVQAAADELVVRNRGEIDEKGDVWVMPIVTGGVGLEIHGQSQPTIAITCTPIPFATRMRLEFYETGVSLCASLVARNPFLPVDPRVKSISRLAYARAQKKMMRVPPGSWTVLFDNEGHVVEAVAAALCIVENDAIVHTPKWTALPSTSLEMFCRVGVDLGFKREERPLTTYDFVNADGAYVLASSFGAYPVKDLDGVPIARDTDVGPKIVRRWTERVNFDFTSEIHGAIDHTSGEV